MSETIGDVLRAMRYEAELADTLDEPNYLLVQMATRLEAAARTAPERVFDLDRGDGLPPDGGPLHEWLYLRAELGLEEA